MSNPSISTEALHNLLKQLFPETEISRRSVDLLAIQLAELEPESSSFTSESTITLFPNAISRDHKSTARGLMPSDLLDHRS